ncbi:MAG: YraN family protein [Limisphaerales bacterium]
MMNLLAKLKACFGGRAEPEHLRRGTLGERAAKKYLRRQGMKFLAANFRSDRGEIDLIFRDYDYSIPSADRKERPPGGTAAGIVRKWLKMNHPKCIRKDANCLVFIEVKTRSSEEWGRPASAVDAERRGRLTRAGLDYLRLLRKPAVKVRFDIVEVLLADGAVREIRHLPNAFPMERPYRYG